MAVLSNIFYTEGEVEFIHHFLETHPIQSSWGWWVGKDGVRKRMVTVAGGDVQSTADTFWQAVKTTAAAHYKYVRGKMLVCDICHDEARGKKFCD